jgi:hypothetical protein
MTGKIAPAYQPGNHRRSLCAMREMCHLASYAEDHASCGMHVVPHIKPPLSP